ncbi:MAG: STAS-like domain-containing protein [Hymenobacteraceae bacterium]|nr:STAS-like domain-containing protein [Hymenobacteraceae bacterium]
MTIDPTPTLMSIVTGTSTNAEGDALYAALLPYVRTGQVVRLSLHGATPMATSFLNTSFGQLIDDCGLNAVRASVKLVQYVPSHALRLKEYLDHYLPYATAA